jgi:hypothetical protein
MTQEPCIATQLNSILEYLNYHGHLFLRVASDPGGEGIGEKKSLSPTIET